MFNEILLKELNEERKELEIDKNIFAKLIALAKYYIDRHEGISEEDIAEVIREAMSVYDYGAPTDSDNIEIRYAYRRRKTINGCFKEALSNLGYEPMNERER